MNILHVSLLQSSNINKTAVTQVIGRYPNTEYSPGAWFVSTELTPQAFFESLKSILNGAPVCIFPVTSLDTAIIPEDVKLFKTKVAAARAA